MGCSRLIQIKPPTHFLSARNFDYASRLSGLPVQNGDGHLTEHIHYERGFT